MGEMNYVDVVLKVRPLQFKNPENITSRESAFGSAEKDAKISGYYIFRTLGLGVGAFRQVSTQTSRFGQ